MKKIFSIALLLFIVNAFSQHAPFSPKCKQTTAWTNQLSTYPSPKTVYSINTFIETELNDGNWPQLDRFWVVAQDIQANSKISIANPTSTAITEVSSPGWIAYQGYTGNTTSSYEKTNFIPSTDGVNYTRNSACFGVYTKSDSEGAAFEEGGSVTGGLGTLLFSRNTNNTLTALINGDGLNGSAYFVPVVTTSYGLNMLVRTGSTAAAVWKDGISLQTNAIASTALTNLEFYIGARNNFAAPLNISGRQISAAILGGGGIDQAKFNAAFSSMGSKMGFINIPRAWFFGDSFTQTIYGGINISNRDTTLVGNNKNWTITNKAVGGQSLTQGCNASSNFDMTTIPVKSGNDSKIVFCWSMLNDIGVTVTSGKPGVPFTNTASNMAQDFTTILNYAHNTKGWAYTDMVYAGDFYVYPVGTATVNAPLQADVYQYADSAAAHATALGVQVISHRAYMIANGMNSLLTSTVVPYNDHPNLSAQPVIAQNIINNMSLPPVLFLLLIGIFISRKKFRKTT